MKDARFLLFVLLVLAVASFIIGRFFIKDRQELIKTDTVTVVKIQEVHDTLPQIKTEKVIKYITLNGKTDTLFVKDSVQGDSMVLPVVQRVYTDDSTYRAYVSGVRVGEYPKMDSIAVRQRLIERTITNTIVRKQHWRFGVGVNAGVSIITGKPDMTAGFFAGYTF
jgi:hypothetical protein